MEHKEAEEGWVSERRWESETRDRRVWEGGETVRVFGSGAVGWREQRGCCVWARMYVHDGGCAGVLTKRNEFP